MDVRKCKECGKKLKGRADQKFCCSDCRSTFNNNLRKAYNAEINRVNRILSKNRKILLQLNPTGKTKVSRDVLTKSGYNLDYMTNQYITKTGKAYHFCYDQGVLALEDGWFALVSRETYV